MRKLKGPLSVTTNGRKGILLSYIDREEGGGSKGLDHLFCSFIQPWWQTGVVVVGGGLFQWCEWGISRAAAEERVGAGKIDSPSKLPPR